MTVNLIVPEALDRWVEETLKSEGPQWLLPGFVPQQGFVIIAGRPKLSKKSWLMSLMMMSLGTGRELGPFKPTKASPVLIMSREGSPPPVASRFDVLARTYGLSLSELSTSFIQQNGSFFLDDPKYVKEVLNFITSNGIAAVAIDTFARSFQGDENNARDVGAAMRGLERIRDAGAAVVLVHHVRKGKTELRGGYPDPDSGMRGSSALAGAYDNIINIQDLVVEGEPELWAVVGGKYMEFVAYKQEWDIRDNKDGKLEYAKLETFDGPQDLPYIDQGVGM